MYSPGDRVEIRGSDLDGHCGTVTGVLRTITGASDLEIRVDGKADPVWRMESLVRPELDEDDTDEWKTP